MTGKSCEQCIHFGYDEEFECCTCDLNLDEDELQRLTQSRYEQCPYFRFGDDYTIVRKQN